jgi:hypothetical protein
MPHSDAYATFRKSMDIGYDQWKEGEGYDLDAFAQMTPEERDEVTREMLEKNQLDWRDMQVLAKVNSKETFDKLRDYISRPHSVQTRAWATRELIDMPGRMSGAVPDKKVADLVETCTDDDGLTTTLDLAREHAGAWTKMALLRGAKERPDVALHFASALLDMAGASDDMAAFDPKFRPTLLKLLPDSSEPERATAFAKVCAWLKIDPATIPDRDSGDSLSWAEKTWPRR